MPVQQPEETKTQDWRERNAASSVAAHTTHDANEIYFAANSIGGDDAVGYDHTEDPPVYQLSNTKHADITHQVPSYWWNGQIKLEIYWTDINGKTAAPDVDVSFDTHRVGESTTQTAVIDSGASGNGNDCFTNVPDGTVDKMYKEEIWSDNDITEEDDIFHINILNNSGAAYTIGLAGIAVEYFPNFEQ